MAFDLLGYKYLRVRLFLRNPASSSISGGIRSDHLMPPEQSPERAPGYVAASDACQRHHVTLNSSRMPCRTQRQWVGAAKSSSTDARACFGCLSASTTSRAREWASPLTRSPSATGLRADARRVFCSAAYCDAQLQGVRSLPSLHDDLPAARRPNEGAVAGLTNARRVLQPAQTRRKGPKLASPAAFLSPLKCRARAGTAVVTAAGNNGGHATKASVALTARATGLFNLCDAQSPPVDDKPFKDPIGRPQRQREVEEQVAAYGSPNGVCMRLVDV